MKYHSMTAIFRLFDGLKKKKPHLATVLQEPLIHNKILVEFICKQAFPRILNIIFKAKHLFKSIVLLEVPYNFET